MIVTSNQILKKYSLTVNQLIKQVRVTSTPTKNSISVTIAPLGKRGFPGTSAGSITKTSGESIPSHTPVVIISNTAYKLDSSNPLHQFAFAGFSENGSSIGQDCMIKQIGEIYLGGWNLIPRQQYLAGVDGALVVENLSETNFTKVIGYASDSNTLQIIKDSITINK